MRVEEHSVYLCDLCMFCMNRPFCRYFDRAMAWEGGGVQDSIYVIVPKTNLLLVSFIIYLLLISK